MVVWLPLILLGCRDSELGCMHAAFGTIQFVCMYVLEKQDESLDLRTILSTSKGKMGGVAEESMVKMQSLRLSCSSRIGSHMQVGALFAGKSRVAQVA